MFNPRPLRTTAQEVVDYQLPEGCPVCNADLPVRVTAKGPHAVCRHCGWVGKPILTVTHRGLRVDCKAAQA
jgi:hypothetical protein